MTRDEAIEVIKAYLVKHDKAEPILARHAFDGPTAMRGCLLMLEALGLVKFDKEKRYDDETGKGV